LAYGLGEVSRAVIQNIRVVVLLYFLTNVAGLNAGLAGTVLLMGRVWDGLNDPLVGWLSDRTQSRFGKRYPWIVAGAIPLGLLTFLQWVVPPFATESPYHQIYLFGYYTLIALLFDATFTAVIVPFAALVPDLAQDYDERTSLVSFQVGFSIVGGIGILLLAQLIFARVPSPTQQYLWLGASGGAIAVVALLLSVWGTYGKAHAQPTVHQPPAAPPLPAIWHQVSLIFRQREFQIVTGIFVLAWVSIQSMVAILPYFIQSWMNLPVQQVTQLVIAMQITALVSLPLWRRLSQRVGKRGVLRWGLPLAILGELGLSLLRTGQTGLMYGCALAIGLGLATVYLMPLAMLPDVIDLDELRHGQRREGLFYSLMMQMQKFGLGIALFLLSQGLSWGGLLSTTGDQPVPVQPPSLLPIIRLEIGLIPALVMTLALALAWHYPITQAQHQAIQIQLQTKP
jgi:GPH family glycoside/pentoside/hexuronide:cation symporter